MSSVKKCIHGRSFCLECHSGTGMNPAREALKPENQRIYPVGTTRDYESELAALREELRFLRHSNASYLETVAKVCEMLGLDLEEAKHAEGQPSDVLFAHAKALRAELAAIKDECIDHVNLYKSWTGERETIKAEIERLKGGQGEPFDMAVSALNDIVKVSRMGEKPFEIATLAIGEMSAIAPQPAQVSVAPERSFSDGIDAAAKLVEKRMDDYINEHGSFDPETGAVEFPGNGEEYVGELVEISEAIRAIDKVKELNK